jgi:iron complex outermembrane receptor protein
MSRSIRSRAALALVVCSTSIHAQDNRDQDAVVVTANRFPQSDPGIPANLTVITREEIRRTPATSLLDVLKNQAGVHITPLYGPLGLDATLDLRGFGDAATSNTLILLDGQRLNPVSSDGINWSVIPLQNVERIEIIRGSGAVLFGDRASGGVVNIITDKSAKQRASAAATLGLTAIAAPTPLAPGAKRVRATSPCRDITHRLTAIARTPSRTNSRPPAAWDCAAASATASWTTAFTRAPTVCRAR